ncbi:MAG: Ig-like domain-containing protein, partial [Paracoccaceae bacterium]
MPVIALFNLNDPSTTALDSAVDNGAQNGVYFNGATSVEGRAVLDGVDDIVKIDNAAVFQLARGTLEIQFSPQDGATLTEPRTILSRDSEGETEGGFRIESLPGGAIRISHESATGTKVYETAPGFQTAGDEISVSYSWDATGPGGYVQITNMTAGGAFIDTVPGTLTMDMGAINQNWIIGASQDTSPPDILRNIDAHHAGSVAYFSISDTVDNTPADPEPPVRDGVVEGTPDGDLIDTAYTGVPDGDFIDSDDAILRGQAPNDDIVHAYDGDDTVFAGAGDDAVFGGAGNDIIDGGGDADSLHGGADRDTFVNVGPGTFVDGGESGDDFDTLDLRGLGPLTVAHDPANAENGTVEFFDDAGASTGTMTFINIENVILPVHGAPIANPDALTTPQFTDITIDVLANDTDPTGQPLTVTSATAKLGDVTINPDGTLTYSPLRDYNGPDDTITYTITDPDGNTATSTVAVTITNVNDV